MNITRLVLALVVLGMAAWICPRAVSFLDRAIDQEYIIADSADQYDPFSLDRASATQQALNAAAQSANGAELGETLYGEDFTNCGTVEWGEGIFDVTTRLTSQEWEYVTVTTSSSWGMYEYYYLAEGNGPVVHQGDEICLLPDGKG
jgi:hypothetical protein